MNEARKKAEGEVILVRYADDSVLGFQKHAESEFEKYRIIQDRFFESDFDKEIKVLEEQMSPRNNQDE